jgi:hypothetical protein
VRRAGGGVYHTMMRSKDHEEHEHTMMRSKEEGERIK